MTEEYKSYLLSPQWMKIRSIVKRRDKYICQLCGSKGWQVHHLTYKHIFNEMTHLEDLVLICGDCHSILHKKKYKIPVQRKSRIRRLMIQLRDKLNKLLR